MSAHVHPPLIRWAPLRGLLCAGLALAALYAVPSAAVGVIHGEPDVLFEAAVLALAATPGCITVLLYGRWSHHPLAALFQVASVLALLGCGVLLVAYCARETLLGVQTVDTLGTDPRDVAAWIGFAGGSVALIALLLSAVPLPGPATWRRLTVAAVGGLAFVVVSASAALATTGPDGCGTFRLDPARWRAGDDTAQGTMAAAIARCGTFDGARRSAVIARLGEIEPISYDSSSPWSLHFVIVGDRVVEAQFDGHGG